MLRTFGDRNCAKNKFRVLGKSLGPVVFSKRSVIFDSIFNFSEKPVSFDSMFNFSERPFSFEF